MMTIAWMTWVEFLRKRVFILTVVMTIAFLGLFLLAVHSMESKLNSSLPSESMDLLNQYLHGALWLAIGLYVSNFTVAYLAIFSSAGTISTEIDNGLLLAILPRPLERWRVYIGKWLGYLAWSLLYGAIVFWSILLIVHAFDPIPLDAESLWKAFGVFELIPSVLVTLSILGSLYFPSLGNGVAMTLLFGLGMIGGFIQRVAPSGSDAVLNKMGFVTSVLIPTNAAYYRMMYELTGGNSTLVGGAEYTLHLGPLAGGAVPSNGFLEYIILYIGMTLAFGLWKFTRKDI